MLNQQKNKLKKRKPMLMTDKEWLEEQKEVTKRLNQQTKESLAIEKEYYDVLREGEESEKNKKSKKNKIFKRYNRWPEWVRWILFLPISSFFSVILWYFILFFFLKTNGNNLDIFSFDIIIEIIHPAVVQIIFLYLIFLTVPRGKLIWVKTLIILRALFLVLFATQPVLNFLGADLPCDIEFFKDIAGEILTLVASIWLFRELKQENTKNKAR